MKTSFTPVITLSNFTLKMYVQIIALLCFCAPAFSQSLLTFTPYVQGLNVPVEIRNAGDGSGRLFVVEQSGKIRIIRNGIIQPGAFLDISAITGYETFQGLWGVVFTQNYARSGVFFVLYTGINGNTELVRYQVSRQNADSADPRTRAVLLSIDGSNSGGPHFGQMHFGRDGYLYVTLSDGSSPGRTTPFAQQGSNLYGKMLRIDVNVKAAPYYSIPADNPFVNDPEVLDEIWALGFRNAWRWSFDAVTGNMWLPDVQGEQEEELNVIAPASSGAGLNFGWPCYEGNLSYLNENCAPASQYRFPEFTYLHDVPNGGQTIIGGYVYRGQKYPVLRNNYICSDLATNNAWIIRLTNGGRIVARLQSGIPPLIQAYGLDEAGEMYAVAGDGIIYSVAVANTGKAITAIPGSSEDISTVTNKIYPTITSSYIILSMKDPFRYMRITDMSGKEVMHRNLNGDGLLRIDLPRLSPGIYLVKLYGKTELQQKIYVSP